MAEWIMSQWQSLSLWASGQPLFLQVALGIGLVIVGLPLVIMACGVAVTLVSSFFLD